MTAYSQTQPGAAAGLLSQAPPLVEEGLQRVRSVMERWIASELPAVQELCRRLEGYQGKMLRPTLALLSGAAFADEPEQPLCEDLIVIAAVVEMVHLATLVHDDVLDEAVTRRKGASINQLCGNETAVILGDYLISRSFHLCSTLPSSVPALRIGQTTGRVCEGELLQLRHRGDFDLDEATYFAIIERKTGSLVGAACELGAWASGASEEQAAAAKRYGELVGTAFQIRDDLLDLTGEERVVGKTLGRDLAKGKLTLPVIHHLRIASEERRRGTLALLKQALGDKTGETVRRAMRQALAETGSIEHAEAAARRCVEQAQATLPCPAGPSRAALLELAEAVLTRSW